MRYTILCRKLWVWAFAIASTAHLSRWSLSWMDALLPHHLPSCTSAKTLRWRTFVIVIKITTRIIITSIVWQITSFHELGQLTLWKLFYCHGSTSSSSGSSSKCSRAMRQTTLYGIFFNLKEHVVWHQTNLQMTSAWTSLAWMTMTKVRSLTPTFRSGYRRCGSIVATASYRV